jgi:hypothetical protein
MKIIVGEGNDGDIQSIVHFVLMLGKRCFTVNEMPPEAVNLWRVSYLLAEVLNGGLAHYISNTSWSPALDHYFERATAPDSFCCLLPPPADAGVRELIAAAAMTMARGRASIA